MRLRDQLPVIPVLWGHAGTRRRRDPLQEPHTPRQVHDRERERQCRRGYRVSRGLARGATRDDHPISDRHGSSSTAEEAVRSVSRMP